MENLETYLKEGLLLADIGYYNHLRENEIAYPKSIEDLEASGGPIGLCHFSLYSCKP